MGRSFREGVVSRWVSGRDQTAAVGERDRLGAIPAAGAQQDPGDVGLHRRLAEHQVLGDLGVVHPGADQLQHLDLPRSQIRQLRVRPGAGGRN